MSAAIVTLAGVVVGSVISAFVQWGANHRADRAQALEHYRADRTQAADLLATVATAAAAIQAALVEYKWDYKLACEENCPEEPWYMYKASELSERFTVAASGTHAALIRLSLMSPDLQQAAIEVTEKLAALIKITGDFEIDAKGDGLAEAVDGLRRAVDAFIA